MLRLVTWITTIAALAAITYLFLLPRLQNEPSPDSLSVWEVTANEPAEVLQEAPSRTSHSQPKVIASDSPTETMEPAESTPQTGWLYGNVIDLANSELVAGADVLLDAGAEGSVGMVGPFFETTTLEDGSFRMSVPIGVWRASLRIPKPQAAGSVYLGEPPRMVHGSVEIFADQEIPFSFLVDSSVSLTGSIFEKDTPEYTSLDMELVRLPSQQVVAIHRLFGDAHWQKQVEGPDGDAMKNPLPPNHGGFLFEYLEPGLYEIRASIIFVEPPSKPTYWSYQVDLVSGNVDIGKHALTFGDLMGKGNWSMAKPDLEALGLDH